MARLARALGTDSLADVDLRQLAKKVRAAGRGRDTVLAHITPAEAKLLKARGGRGSVNPKTGLPEFEDDFYDFGGGADYGGFDFGGDGNQQIYDSGADFAPQDYLGDGGPDQTEALVDPNLTQQGLTEFADPGNLPQPGPGDNPASAEATAARGVFDAANPEVASIANANEAAGVRSDAAAAQSPGFLERLTSGLGLGGLGNIGGADLLRLGLAGAGVGMGVQARNAALQQARASQGQIQNIADQAQQRAATTQQAMTGTAQDVASRAPVVQAAMTSTAQDVASRAPAVQAAMTNTAENVASRAAPAQAAIQALATPYQELGKQQVQQAFSGALTPMSAQSLQAAQARQAQAQARSGGVGVAQGINQLENLRQALLANQYQQGIGTQQIGDRYAQSGINTGLAQGNLGSQYSNLATTTGLAQGNLGSQYSNLATTTGLAQGNLGSQYSNLALTTGLNASRIADQYTLRAIQAGLAGNQQAQRLSQQYFQSLSSILGGTPALRAQQPATTAVG